MSVRDTERELFEILVVKQFKETKIQIREHLKETIAESGDAVPADSELEEEVIQISAEEMVDWVRNLINDFLISEGRV